MAACQVIAWTLAPAFAHSSPPLDVVEGYMWGREWVLATYKHPALPSWVLEITRIASGTVGWPAYLVSQLFIAATYVFVFLLGRDLLGPRRAAAGTLLLTGISFYAWPTTEFNHNIAQMPFWAALPWALWRAVERNGTGWWVLAGVLAAGGVYAKLTFALLLIALAAWMVWDRDARRCLATLGPWLGLAVLAALIAPLAQWLVAHHFAPLRYAASRSQASQTGLQTFLVGLLISVVGTFVLLAIAGLIGPRAHARPEDGQAEPQDPPVAARGIRYLALITTAPLALILIGAGLSGSSLKVAWSSSFFTHAGVFAIALTSARFSGQALRRIAICAGVILMMVPLGYFLVVEAWPLQSSSKPLRVNWPQAEISKRFVDIWARETGQPLRIVSGDAWIAGLVGVTAADRPSILSGADLAASPWITPERLEKEGMLVVWNAKNAGMPEFLLPLIADAPVKEERFGWKRPTKGGEIAIRYVVVPPRWAQR